VVYRDSEANPSHGILDAQEWTTLFQPKRQWVYFC
jgi:hypothetical protein